MRFTRSPVSMLCLAVGCLTLTSALTAQIPAPSAEQVRVRIHLLSVIGNDVDGLTLFNGRTPLKVRAPVDYLSEPIDYRGPPFLAFYSTDALESPPPPPPPPGHKPSPPPPLTTVELPKGIKEVVVLFGGSRDDLRTAAIDFSMDAAPLGSYTFWNLTNRPLAVTLGETNATIPVGRQGLIHPSDPDRTYLPLRVFDQAQGAARQLFASRHFHHDTTRQIVFVTNAGDGNRVRLKIITQRVFPALPEPDTNGSRQR